MNKAPVMIWFLAVVLAQCSVFSMPVIVPNQGAEEEITGPQVSHWVEPGTEAAFERSTATARTGTGSLHTLNKGPKSAVWILAAEVVPGLQYEATAWVKTLNARQAAIGFRFKNAAGAYVDGKCDEINQVAGTADWTRVTAKGKAPEPAAAMDIFLVVREGGEAWFDDVEVSDDFEAAAGKELPEIASLLTATLKAAQEKKVALGQEEIKAQINALDEIKKSISAPPPPCSVPERRKVMAMRSGLDAFAVKCRAAMGLAGISTAGNPAGAAATKKRSGLQTFMARCLAAVGLASTQEGSITLASGGRTDYRIILPQNASASEKAGAAELAKYLKEISGAEFPIGSDKEKPRAKEIVLGNSQRLASLGLKIDWDKLGRQGLCIKTSGKTLVIAGGPQGGTINGIYEFLEKFLGCRWYALDLTVVPRREKLTITAIDYTYAPPFTYRRHGWHSDQHPDWAAPNHINVFFDHARELPKKEPRLADSWYYPQNAVVHTLGEKLCSVKKYFSEHPGYFAEINGQRIKEKTQLCLSNPEVFKIVVNDARELLKEPPRYKRIGIYAADWENYCGCKECKKLYDQYGVAGTYIEFANRCTVEIAKDYPEVIIETGIYRWQRSMPPDIKFHPNLGVWFCPIEGCIYHALDECAYNASEKFIPQLKAWSKAVKHLTLFLYTDSAEYLTPYPIIRAMSRNWKMARDLGADGVCVEGHTRYAESQLGTLTSYLIAKLLWNPDYDVQQGIDEFVKAYYGPAALEIRQYVAIVNDEQAYLDTNASRMMPYGGFHAAMQNPEFLDFKENILAALSKLMDTAEQKVADNPKLLYRVKVVRMPLQVKIMDQLPPGNPLRDQALKNFFDFIPQTGVNTIKVGSVEDYRKEVMAKTTKIAAEAALLAQLPHGRELVPVPETWLFRTDPEHKAEQEQWFLDGKTDGNWKMISTHKYWDYFLEQAPYMGDGWYAVDLAVPSSRGKKVWLVFEAVDENYTLWINGKYIADNLAAGITMWDKPVAVEITGRYQPDARNHFVVRVKNTKGSGGIWKPVRIICEE